MVVRENAVKRGLAGGRLQTGFWLTLADPAVAEIAGRTGVDWCLIDAEHGPNTLPTIHAQLLALDAAGCPAVVRVASADPVLLKQTLDIGAQTVLVPMIETAEDAAATVAACRYPPDGFRGNGGALMRAGQWGRIPGYAAGANEEVCVIVQAESRTAMANIRAIAAVDGVDCVFIGPADLAGDMGHLGAPDHPEVRRVIEEGVAAVRGEGKAVGIFASDLGEIASYARLGVTFLGVGADASLLAKALHSLSSEVRTAIGL